MLFLRSALLILEKHGGRKAVESRCKENSKWNVSDHIHAEMMGHLGWGIQTIHLSQYFCNISATQLILPRQRHIIEDAPV